jgi:hypothetical protein
MAVITTSQTSFGPNEQITSTKLNNILAQSLFISGAVSSDATLTVTAGGQLQVGTLKTSNFPTGGIFDANIADATITPVKLSAGAPAWTSSSSSFGSGVTGSYSTNLTPARTGDGDSALNFGSQAATTSNASITRKTGVNGTFDFVNTGTGAMKFTSSGGFQFGTAPMPTPVGSTPIFGIRAWVKFEATSNANVTGTYVRVASSSTITVTATGHGLIVGNVVFLDFTSLVSGTPIPLDGLYTVTAIIGVDSFTVNSNTNTAATGSVTLNRRLIKASGNVSNVVPACPVASANLTDNFPTTLQTVTAGLHVINFPIPMQDGQFSISGSCNETNDFDATSSGYFVSGIGSGTQYAYIATISDTGVLTNCKTTNIQIIR